MDRYDSDIQLTTLAAKKSEILCIKEEKRLLYLFSLGSGVYRF